MINESVKLSEIRYLKAVYEFKTYIKDEWFRVYMEENVKLEGAKMCLNKETNEIETDLTDCITEFHYIGAPYGNYAGTDIYQLKKSYESRALMEAQDIAFNLISQCVSRGDWVNWNWEGAEYVDYNNVKVRCLSVELI